MIPLMIVDQSVAQGIVPAQPGGSFRDSTGHRPDHQHKVDYMSAFDRIATRLPRLLAPRVGRRQSYTRGRKFAPPALETLEKIELLSRAGLVSLPAADVVPFSQTSIHINTTMAQSTPQTSQTQLAVVSNTLTNFNLPFTPPIALFNPSLGQLVDVKVTSTATLSSLIKSQNLSTTTGADISGFSTGSFEIAGLITPLTGNLNGTTNTISVPAFGPGDHPDFTGPTTAVFPPLTTTKNASNTFTSPADLAFFTASAGHTSISPTLVMSAQAGATAPNGNLQTEVTTSGSGQITVVYDYIPMCPAVVSLVRFGIHHQPTQLQLTFSAPVNTTDLANTANYTVVVPNKSGSFTGPGVTYVPIVKAIPNATGTMVTLITGRQLNVHQLFQLQIKLPCNNGNTVVLEFGSKQSLGGFFNPHSQKNVTVVKGKTVKGHK
jgi:hypothetical protein